MHALTLVPMSKARRDAQEMPAPAQPSARGVALVQAERGRRPSHADKGGLLTRTDVAKALGCSTTAVRKYEAAQRLIPCATTNGGTRLFARAEVARFAAERSQVVAGPADVAGSMEAAAFRLFESGAHPIEVVCKLCLSSETVDRMHRNWTRMRGGLLLGPEQIAQLEASGQSRADLLAGRVPVAPCAHCSESTARFCGACLRTVRGSTKLASPPSAAE